MSLYPKAEQRTINTQLPDFEMPVVKTYSLETQLLKNFDAILQRFGLYRQNERFLRYLLLGTNIQF